METIHTTKIDVTFGTAFKIGAGIALGSIAVCFVPWIILVMIMVAIGVAGA